MFEFLRNMWIMRRVTDDKIMSYVPNRITAEQAQEILATPQISQ